MTNSEISLTVVSAVLGLIVAVLTILTFFKNDKRESKTEAREIALLQGKISELEKNKADATNIFAVSTDLGYIKDGINEMKDMLQEHGREQAEMKVAMIKLEGRVQAIEAQIEQAKKKNTARQTRGSN